MTETSSQCDYCAKDVRHRPWILLNRYAIGTGKHKRLSETRTEDGDYYWDPETNEMTGTLLCWPECLAAWIEGKMVQTDYECSKE